jgi:hypothetical protein
VGFLSSCLRGAMTNRGEYAREHGDQRVLRSNNQELVVRSGLHQALVA